MAVGRETSISVRPKSLRRKCQSKEILQMDGLLRKEIVFSVGFASPFTWLALTFFLLIIILFLVSSSSSVIFPSSLWYHFFSTLLAVFSSSLSPSSFSPSFSFSSSSCYPQSGPSGLQDCLRELRLLGGDGAGAGAGPRGWGEECSNAGEVIPNVTLVPTISLECKRVLNSSNKALTAGGLGMPGGGGLRPCLLTRLGSESGLCIYLCLQHPFLLFQIKILQNTLFIYILYSFILFIFIL